MMGTARNNPFINSNDILKLNDDSDPRTSDELSSLILWNVSKALEKNPLLNLKNGLAAAEKDLEKETRDENAAIDKCPEEEQHLVCALLAWQQLGHNSVASLYQFIERNKREEQSSCSTNDTEIKNNMKISHFDKCNSYSNSSRDWNTVPNRTYAKGPVVKLPVDTKIIMRAECDKSCGGKVLEKSACCADTACAESLANMDKVTDELRTRAQSLAKREAERVELLERAEVAWGDLELGYQRRLKLAEDKQADLEKQIQSAIIERNNLKEQCTELAGTLKPKGDAADKERTNLIKLQKEVCARACIRLKLSEEASKGEAQVAEEQCKAMQLDRDLQFKEEQARRQLLLIESETESARALMHDAERAMHAELGGLRDQINQVSKQLLEEDEESKRIKAELEELREEKDGLVEDLDGCKVLCEKRMQAFIDDAQKKREELEELKEKVMECRCKLPVHVAVEAKRTPSLVALCKCAPEDRILESCSCSSLRSTLLSTLLADLFGGLQSELNGAGQQMPCQLMKCLEDKHNWDRASVVKTNLRDFFTKLLVGELDIAIASSIENYHARWVGMSCADAPKMMPGPEDDLKEGWEARAVERRAQRLAAKLAEQLFEQREEQLTKRAKEIVTTGPPPCECNKKPKKQDVMPCLVTPITPFDRPHMAPHNYKQDILKSPTSDWNRTNHDVTELKHQMKALKKESIKKEDLKLMEENITKIIKRAAAPENDVLQNRNSSCNNNHNAPQTKKKETKNMRTTNTEETLRSHPNRSGIMKRKPLEQNNVINSKKRLLNDKFSKYGKKNNYSQDYAVNLCLCGQKKSNKALPNAQVTSMKSFLKQNSSNEIICQDINSMKVTNIKLPKLKCDSIVANRTECSSDCKCLQKKPSNKSIDKLLGKIAKWKCDLENPTKQNLDHSRCILDSKYYLNRKSKSGINTDIETNSNRVVNSKNTKGQVGESESGSKIHKNVSENYKANSALPINTTSEYMADINLDKSYEFTKKHVDINKSNKQSEYKNNYLNQCLLKNINTEPNKSKDSLNDNVIKKHNDLTKKERLNTDLKLLTNSKSTRAMSPSTYDQSEIKQVINETQDLQNEVMKSTASPNNVDYYIKFLGVTLADADSDKVPSKEDRDQSIVSLPHDIYRYENEREKEEPLTTKTPTFIKNPNILDLKENVTGAPSIKQKDECNNTKFEIIQYFLNFINDQLKLKCTQQKDIALDSQSFDFPHCSLNSCVCCPNITDTAKDLEVNTFDLLESHLKEKLNEFKKCSCKSSCFPPNEEEKVFSAILKKVKQVISDCANEAKGNEAVALTNDGSWRRVYGLLQEYLKVKLKRVQCLPTVNENSDRVLPNILDKVSKLIEHDFQRLKDICKCKKNDKVSKLFINEDLPEKDTNNTDKNGISTSRPQSIQNSDKPAALKQNIASQETHINVDQKTKECDAVIKENSKIKVLSKQNFIKPTVLTKTISSQVPPNLGMATKSCDILEKYDKTQETALKPLTKSPEQFIYNDCNCKVDKKDANCGIYKLFRTNDVLLNLCIGPVPKLQQKVLGQPSYDKLVFSKSLPNFALIDKIKKIIDVNTQEINYKESVCMPLVGCTLECSCENNYNLKTCVCTKSAIRDHNISKNWKQFIENNQKCIKDLSYIMCGKQKNNKDNVYSINDDTIIHKPTLMKQKVINSCATETFAASGNDIVLVFSDQNIKYHQSTNTSDLYNINIGNDIESSVSHPWYESKSYQSETRPIGHRSNSVCIYQSIDGSVKYCKSETTTHTQNCNCTKVPICHVKMLVNTIERNLLNSKCTCDILSTVCPVHF